MGFPHLPYPLVNIQKAIEAMAIEIVDLPISMVMFHVFLFTFTRPGSFSRFAGRRNQQAPLHHGRLMMPESEFRGHRHVLSRYPKGPQQPGMDQRIKADGPLRRLVNIGSRPSKR